MGVNNRIKTKFLSELKEFASTLTNVVSSKDEWNIRGFVDVFKNVYSLSADPKLISKVLEIHLLLSLLEFADNTGYVIELPTHQNWYPDLTFISKANPDVKFAVDLKTTYRLDERPDYCNGFTLGSHDDFVDRLHCKNIQYPYASYGGHFCLGVIYSRANISNEFEAKTFPIDSIALIPAVIRKVVFFANEKWKIASDKCGSGSTANIGSVKRIDDAVRAKTATPNEFVPFLPGRRTVKRYITVARKQPRDCLSLTVKNALWKPPNALWSFGITSISAISTKQWETSPKRRLSSSPRRIRR